MSRLLLTALAACALLVSAAGATAGQARIQGTVAAKFPENNLVRVDSRSMAHILRVAGSQARIRLGQRVELRGTTLRQRGNGSRVLARNVVVARSVPKSGSNGTTGGSLAPRGDDELEVKGKISSLAPLTVTTASGTATCSVPSSRSLAGFAVGDFVEMTCDLVGGVWVVRVLKHEDDDARGNDDDDDDDTTDDESSDDSTDDDDDDHGNRGPGGGHDD